MDSSRWLSFGVLALVSGCSTFTVRPDFDARTYRTLAVLPFDGDLDASIAFQGGVEQVLLACHLGVTDRITVLQGLRRSDPELPDYRQLGIWLHADLFLSGGLSLNVDGVEHVNYRGVKASDGLLEFSGSLGPGGSPRRNGEVVGEKICALFHSQTVGR